MLVDRRGMVSRILLAANPLQREETTFRYVVKKPVGEILVRLAGVRLKANA
jgi:hypothetical protein